MDIGEATVIFNNLFNDKYSIEEKGLAIRRVIDMETHNSVSKVKMLVAMNWMWNQIFELNIHKANLTCECRNMFKNKDLTAEQAERILAILTEGTKGD